MSRKREVRETWREREREREELEDKREFFRPLRLTRTHACVQKKGNEVRKKENKKEGGKVLGCEVDKLYEILIKTSNATKYIESDIQKIEAPRTDNPII